MTKSTITKTWIAGLVIFAAGVVVAIVALFLMLAYGGTFTKIADTNNYNFNPNLNAFFWTTVGLMIAGGGIAVIGGIVQLAAWIGGLVNSYQLADKMWFWILLLGGILSFAFAPIGFAAMVAYVIAAPEGTPAQKPTPTTFQPTVPLAPTT